MIIIVVSFTFISLLNPFSKSELMSVSQKVDTDIRPTFEIKHCGLWSISLHISLDIVT